MKYPRTLFNTLSIFILVVVSQFSVVGSAKAACSGVVYVSPTGNNSTGCDWSTAFNTLQGALAVASSGNEIWVAAGTYTPGTLRTDTFQLVSGVSIYGGFSGVETARGQRNSDPATNGTVLSGDIGTLGSAADNVYSVVTINSGGISAVYVLDGFTITGGNNDSGTGHGGGIYIVDASPTLTNLIVSGNSANANGGGVYVISNATAQVNYSKPTLTNIKFINNTAARGGGFYLQNASPTVSNVLFSGNSINGGAGAGINSQTLLITDEPNVLKISDTTFANNIAVGGGGLFVTNTNLTTDRVTFNGNTASRRGGAVLVENATSVFTNVTFYGNSSSDTAADPKGGGAVMLVGGTTTFNNVTFNGNNSALIGGDAIRNSTNASLVVKNSILWGDTNDEVTDDGTTTATISDSVVQGGCPANTTCTNVINSNPLLASLASNGGFTQTMALQSGSSAINTGGGSFACSSTDQRGVTRPNGQCDIGAYEAELLTVTADSKSIFYGNSDPDFTFQYSGFTNGDTSSVIDTPPACSVSGVHVNAGTYSIVCSGGADNKYTFVFVNGTLTIQKATPTLSVSNSPVIFDGTAFSATVTGSVPGTASSILTGGAASQTNAGTYAVTANFVPTDTTNYNSLTGASAGNFVINPDIVMPVVTSILRANPNSTSATSVTFTVTFSEKVTGVNLVSPYSDFLLSTSGLTGVSITSVSGSGTTYSVTVNTGTGNGTIKLDVIDDDSIKDVANNPLGGSGTANGNFTNGEIYAIIKGSNDIDRWTQAFDLSHGWTVKDYVRTVGDVNGDGRDDIVGFGLDGVYVALAKNPGPGFDTISRWSTSLAEKNGWTVKDFVRTVGDVNGDGKDDLIGFGLDGVYVALSNGASFDPVNRLTQDFDLNHGWTVKDFVRTVGDVNGDGRDDLIGFGLDGVYVALAQNPGPGFGTISKWSASLSALNGWTVADHVRTVGDVNGDGRDDLIGFGLDGVYVALALNPGPGFGPVNKLSGDFNLSKGWTVAQYARTVGDMNGDGKIDLIGFGLDGVYVALSTGDGFTPASKWTNSFDLLHGWTVKDYARTVGDVNGDGKADMVGFGLDGVYVATSK